MEHRCSPRVLIDSNVVICQYAKPVAIGRIKDATAFGFYIESDLIVGPLQQLTLEIMMYRQPQKLQKYKLEAIVAHIDDHGFGVELEQLNDEQTHLLHDFLIVKPNLVDMKEEPEMEIKLAVNG
jgi:hypothetical protein